MAVTGGLFINEYTSLLQKMVRQVVNDPSTYKGAKYLPSVALPSAKIYIDVVEASGGLTAEHVLNTDPKTVQGIGTSTEEVEGGAWKEELVMGEKDLLRLRDLGNNDPSQRGARRYVDLNVDKLNRRLEARIEKLRWDSIFNGGFTYLGRTISFGVPGANQLTPLGAVWSSNGTSPNASANPVADLRYWFSGAVAVLRKYKIRAMVMNPKTAYWIMGNANTQSLIQYRFAAENFQEFDLNRTLQFLIPGLPVCEVYDGWYQDETYDSNGKATVGDATFFIPDGYIFLEVSNLPGGDMIGEFMQGLHLASGSIDQPGFGKYLLIEDNTAPGTKGGPQNPFISLVAGVHGGPKIDRPFDVVTAKVVA